MPSPYTVLPAPQSDTLEYLACHAYDHDHDHHNHHDQGECATDESYAVCAPDFGGAPAPAALALDFDFAVDSEPESEPESASASSPSGSVSPSDELSEQMSFPVYGGGIGEQGSDARQENDDERSPLSDLTSTAGGNSPRTLDDEAVRSAAAAAAMNFPSVIPLSAVSPIPSSTASSISTHSPTPLLPQASDLRPGLSSQIPAAHDITPAATTAVPTPASTTRQGGRPHARSIHKKPRSYDLHDDFIHAAPAAQAALAHFHESHRRNTTAAIVSAVPKTHGPAPLSASESVPHLNEEKGSFSQAMMNKVRGKARSCPELSAAH